jgi:hypothetical protein
MKKFSGSRLHNDVRRRNRLDEKLQQDEPTKSAGKLKYRRVVAPGVGQEEA